MNPLSSGQSSILNMIQPALLCKKLQNTQVDASTITWMTDYLTNRLQFVRLTGCVSHRVVSSTGAPQGTVFSPFLFSLYTSDFQRKSEFCHLQKYSDDSAVVGVSVANKRLSTENWWTALWYVVGAII